MKQTFTIPSKDVEFLTDNVSINLTHKNAVVYVNLIDSGSQDDHTSVKNIDIASAFSGSMSPTEVTAFKKGIKIFKFFF